jgi:hypothetical protein
MSIDLMIESPPVPLADVPDLPCIPRRRLGRKLHRSTVFRWVNPGVRGVRLEVIRVGNVLCTSLAALERFFQRLAALPPAAARPSDRRREDLARVNEELDRERL